MNRLPDQSVRNVAAIEGRKSASRDRQTEREQAKRILETEFENIVTRAQRSVYWDKYKQFDQKHPYEPKPCRTLGCEGVALGLLDLQPDVASSILRYCLLKGDTHNYSHALCEKCFPKFVSSPSGKFLRETEDE